MEKYTLKIIDIIDETDNTKTYFFEKPENLTWEPGSHTHIAHIGFDIGDQPRKEWVRHMSIITLPEENKIAITTRVPGSKSVFKNKLAELKIGDEVVFFKIGSRMGLRRINRPIILISMGVGIATMRPLILSFINDKTKIPYLSNINIDSSDKFVFKNQLDKLVDENYKNYWVNSRKEFYEILNKLMKAEDTIYYVVGSDAFIKDIVQRLRLNNVKIDDIVIDRKDEKKQKFLEN
ncbi:FAD-dependent oxidoreductase [Clostridium beijerinckii]|uniref:FAD-dependent oxidoreductase n=1 Tax=Clostridium beijerinckii TaxID=1520 RepID=UPI0022DFFAB3|nr:FAD-dependent oxidoreductase [Clostridium beijerinckii]